MKDFTSYIWRMWSSSQISKIKAIHRVLGKRHAVLVAGLAVSEKVLPYAGGHSPVAGVKIRVFIWSKDKS